MERFGTSKVTTVGHSLGMSDKTLASDYRMLNASGAGISLLDAIFLRLHIPDATIRFVGFGTPRVRLLVADLSTSRI